MRQSQLFTKTKKAPPKDEVAKNAQLLLRAGFIHKEMAGVYDFLPLGLRTLNKIIAIIREEMNAIGGQEIALSALQNPEHWKQTGRWGSENVDAWFTTELRDGSELGLGFTHEEPLTALMREQISSWRDLPSYPYQFQLKFRNEERAKSGLMRTREFIMKDLYSFVRNEADHKVFYDKAAQAYKNIFARVGIGERTFMTFASGGSFSKYSHEFQTVCDAGEDTIYIDESRGMALNKEVYEDEEVYGITGMEKSSLKEAKAVEVGNIFTLGSRFSDALGLTYKNEEGENVPVFMGCYGIGPARLMAVIAELLSDEKGLVWPDTVAPFQVHLISISGGNAEVQKEADRVYELLVEHGIDVLYDDRDLRAGEKFADSELIGTPKRFIISEKTMAQGGVESVDRATGKTGFVADSAILEAFGK
ncbi:MAG TPA: aminoacyl--tRNA ligase-related protein [Candidatus Paceibacterota bacterium]|nr:aminoacyl--tRNA ligase-related protein [Candidatus Paceibacterota bacterium]